MEYGLGELAMDRREAPPPWHNMSCLAKHPQVRDYSSRLYRSIFSERQILSRITRHGGILQFQHLHRQRSK
eukprot:5986647-Pyramimonas_sp.AAC.1